MTRKKMNSICQTVNIEIDYFKSVIKDFERKALSFFHMNVCSLNKNFDDCNILLTKLNVSFDILAITESRI